MGIFDWFKKKKIIEEEIVQKSVTQKTTKQKVGYQHTTSNGDIYYLNEKEVETRNGRLITIQYFSKNLTPYHCDLPKGIVVRITEDGLPYLAKQGTPDIGLVKYKYRLELNVTKYEENQELFRYDVYDPNLADFPDGYGSFVKNNYDGDHISSADNGNIKDYPYYKGKFNDDAETELNDEYGYGYKENIDEFGAFESYKQIEEFIKKDANERFM